MSDQSISDSFQPLAPLRRADVVFKSHPRAKRYLAKVDKEGHILLTVPRAGTQRDALAFANKHRAWLEEEREKALRSLAAGESVTCLGAGDFIWFRGEKVELKIEKDFGRPVLRFGSERLFIADENMNLARPLKERIRQIAQAEFPHAVHRLAAQFGEKVKKVVVRDQKTRWGSCSTSGTISLNWRLALTAEATRDYVIIHELMHMRRFDHSPAFWALVEKACPDYRTHENWLKSHQDELNW
ncbi:M48 family metallopeptidase [Pelagicoccus albus]|uniref:M48 family metallopeptidase n=1 Tax=Pelagicoccus albus TaxID=415222 RepID=A0A7X1E9S1_9BACT|nr:SprT family zinc-dependent metalloprotease [Pelagicoccus albus]MBC2607641.1 M48 family metallopeptidase [Pelagicoccus albus]